MIHDPGEVFVTTLCEVMRRLTETELKVLLLVGRRTLDSGAADVALSIKDLTQATGLSSRGVVGAVQALTSKRLLTAQQHRDARGGYQPTHYTLPRERWSAQSTQPSAHLAQGQDPTMTRSPLHDTLGVRVDHAWQTQGQRTREAEGQERPWRDILVPTHFVVNHKTWEFCVRNVYRRKPTLLTGPTGCGKTELIAHLAQATGRQVYAVHMGATTDPRAALIGTTHFRDGATTFAPSRFLQGIQDPNGLVLLDEITRADDDANNILFPLLDGQRALSLDEAHPPRLIEVHPQVVFFATANIGQEYTGTRAFDRALHDRFCIVELDYPPEDAEVALLTARSHLPRKEAHKLVAFAHACRELWRRDELATPVSTRMLLEAAEAVRDGFSVLEALEYTIFPLFDARAGADAERAKVRQLLQRF